MLDRVRPYSVKADVRYAGVAGVDDPFRGSPHRRFDGAHLESREDAEDRTVTSASGRASHGRCAEKRAIHRGKNHPTCRFLLASGLIDFPRACSAENSVFCGDFRGTRAEARGVPRRRAIPAVFARS